MGSDVLFAVRAIATDCNNRRIIGIVVFYAAHADATK
jgi:hypothetical protein